MADEIHVINLGVIYVFVSAWLTTPSTYHLWVIIHIILGVIIRIRFSQRGLRRMFRDKLNRTRRCRIFDLLLFKETTCLYLRNIDSHGHQSLFLILIYLRLFYYLLLSHS